MKICQNFSVRVSIFTYFAFHNPIAMTSDALHPVVCFGETLWDVLPDGKQPGGAPMNVAYHLGKLGKNPAVISRVGKDELAKNCSR